MKSIEYPNVVSDLVVIEFRGGGRVGFTVRPLGAGYYRLVIWPEGLPDPSLFAHALFCFESTEGEPLHAVVDMRGYRARPFGVWQWALLPTSPSSSPLDDLARAATGFDVQARNRFRVSTDEPRGEVRCVAWSCHQPYETEAGRRAVLQEDAAEILEWYAAEVDAYQPHVVWGQGDTGYSDGTDAVDFSNQVYDQGDWYRNIENRTWLRQEYRRMYRHFWSLPQMRRVLSAFPHLFMWDDHEIHDGWGSEGRDFQPGNIEMFRIAKEVANEYILNAGPRVRPDGAEAHQAYLMGPMAAFIFDTRSTRNYEAPRDRLISREQYEDFVGFLRSLREATSVRHLVTCTTVPFISLRTWVTALASRAPNAVNNTLLTGIRDDVRDAWNSPGNISTLTEILAALRWFMRERPDVSVSNISGDIHVAQAYELHIPGAPRPVYQVTTSAITNRHHPPDLVAYLAEVGDVEGDTEYVEGIGHVRRIWSTITDPNVLLMQFRTDEANYTLKVWDTENPREKELSLSA